MLQAIAHADDSSVTEALRRIIRTETVLREELSQGNKILIGDKNSKPIKELLRY